jgi:hypothetical protein
VHSKPVAHAPISGSFCANTTGLAGGSLGCRIVAVAFIATAASIFTSHVSKQVIQRVFFVVVGLIFANCTTFKGLPPADNKLRQANQNDHMRGCITVPVTAPRFNEMTPKLEVLYRNKCREAIFSKFANQLFKNSADSSAKSPDKASD